MSEYKTRKQQLETLAAKFGLPICFREDMDSQEGKIILKWSDGTESHIWADVNPKIVNDNQIHLELKMHSTHHNLSQDF